MRRKRENQLPLSGLWTDYRLAQELRAVSKILDDNSSILDLVLHDLCDNAKSGQGAPGFSADQVLRAAILKHRQQRRGSPRSPRRAKQRRGYSGWRGTAKTRETSAHGASGSSFFEKPSKTMISGLVSRST